MKVYAISDLHLSINNPKPMDIFGPAWDNYIEDIFADWAAKVSDDDVVLISGDISWAMTLENAQADIDLIAKNKGKKIILRGNHDYWWASISKVRKALPLNFYALQNDAMKIDGVIFCGSRGWTLPEYKALTEKNQVILDREVIRLEMSLKAAKALQTNGEKIICMMHFPPFNSRRQDSVFTKMIENYNVGKVVYGHLHGGDVFFDAVFSKNGVDYIMTSCDLVKNKLIEIL